MTNSREIILNRIGRSLKRIGDVADINEAFATLIRQKREPVQPPLSETLVEGFVRAAGEAAATVHSLNTLDEFAPWLEKLARKNQPLVLSPNIQELAGRLSRFNITEDVKLSRNWGIVRAYAGIAETGTVVSFSEDCPSGMLFLVERLIVVLNKEDIVAYQEDIWQKLRQRFGGNMPRAVNFITGPSRTADVEQTIQLGAHGPRWVDYVLVSGNSGA